MLDNLLVWHKFDNLPTNTKNVLTNYGNSSIYDKASIINYSNIESSRIIGGNSITYEGDFVKYRFETNGSMTTPNYDLVDSKIVFSDGTFSYDLLEKNTKYYVTLPVSGPKTIQSVTNALIINMDDEPTMILQNPYSPIQNYDSLLVWYKFDDDLLRIVLEMANI